MDINDKVENLFSQSIHRQWDALMLQLRKAKDTIETLGYYPEAGCDYSPLVNDFSPVPVSMGKAVESLLDRIKSCYIVMGNKDDAFPDAETARLYSLACNALNRANYVVEKSLQFTKERRKSYALYMMKCVERMETKEKGKIYEDERI